MTYKIDINIVEAIKLWHNKGIPPGSCTEYLLRGDYEEAFLHAHPLIKPFWNDHIQFVENEVPSYCRGKNYDIWKYHESRQP